MSRTAESDAPEGRKSRAAAWVGAGIFLSRVTGFLRESVFAYYFGVSAVADVWRAALRTPYVIQNLLGEGTLSASLIPVYAEFLEEGREEDAGRFAGAALGILTVVAFGLALLGMLLAPLLIRVFFFEWEPWMQELGIRIVRILFPMTAVLVVSAWALGVLNSHRRFFVSYVAPVAWNLTMVATLVGFGTFLGWEQAGRDPELLVALAWGALAGGMLQLLVQLPWVGAVLRHFRLSLGRGVAGVREAIRNFLPVVAARGVVNLSSWLDMVLAGMLAVGAQALLGFAQTLYILPISLFGMSIAASELPELSRNRRAARNVLAPRVREALDRLAFLLLPSALAYLVLGDIFIAALFQRGEFDATDTTVTHVVLAAYALGLPASASSRALSSAFYALRDTRTPARIATGRVALSVGLGAALMFPLDRFTVGDLHLGAAGLALGSAVGAWLEYVFLRRSLTSHLGPHGPGLARPLRMLLAGLAAGAAGWGARTVLGFSGDAGLLPDLLGPDSFWVNPLSALATAAAFGVTYLGGARLLDLDIPFLRS
jgi:putative peptidoglycan lipid II flippase